MMQTLTKAATFRAWRVTPEDQGNPRHEAQAVDLPEWIETAEDAAKVATNCLAHKALIYVEYTDAAAKPERRHLLHTFAVKKRAQRGYVRNAAGKAVREPAEYPVLLGTVHLREPFVPVEPWTMADGNAVGRDTTLVEGKVSA